MKTQNWFHLMKDKFAAPTLQFMLALAVMASLVSTITNLANAQTQPPALVESIFFGGAGSQRGTSVGISESSLFVAGWDQATGLDGLLVRYNLPPVAPVWSATKLGANYNGVTVTSNLVFPFGAVVPGTCVGDVAGGVQRRSVLARYTHAGAFLDCTSPNVFPFDGQESYDAAATAEEGGQTFVYVAGRAQQNAFGTGSPFILVKHDETGAIAAGPVTEPGSPFLCPGESSAEGLTVLNGHVYVVGYSRLGGVCLEDNFNRPIIMKYSTNLNRVWKTRANLDLDFDSDFSYLGHVGSFHAVVGLNNSLYAVGGSTPSSLVGLGGLDYLIEKYDQDGRRIWSSSSSGVVTRDDSFMVGQQFGGPGDDILTSIVVVESRLFAIGYTYSFGSGGADVVILEIDPNTGAMLSETLFGGVNDDFGHGGATDGKRLYIVGESKSFASNDGNIVGQNDVMILQYAFPPVANAGEDKAICANASTTIGSIPAASGGEGGPYAFSWSPADGLNQTDIANPTASPLTTTTYTLTVIETATNLTDTDEMTVTVNPLPVVTFNPVGPFRVTESPVDLSGEVSPAGGAFAGPGVSDNTFDPAVAGVGTHHLTYTFTDGNSCTNSASQDVVVVQTPQQATGSLVDQVQALIDAGTLNQGQGNGLVAKLEAAIQQLDNGNINAAINQLQSFINQVNDFMSSTPPILTAAEGQPLIDAANAIIAVLSTTGKAAQLNSGSSDLMSKTEGALPTGFRLEQNSPNPFNPVTTIQFSVPHESHIRLKVYNFAGQEVATLADRQLAAGTYKVNWNASRLASGVYFYRLEADGFIQMKKLLLTK